MPAEFSIEPLGGNFGVAARGIDCPTLTDHGIRKLLLNLYEHRVVVLETAGLTPAEYVAFARRLGDPIPLSASPDYPEIARITNVGIDSAKTKRGAAHWHTDQSFRETVSSITMLYSVQAPASGGETRFCDMAAAYQALPAAQQARIEHLRVEHRHGASIAARPGDHTPIPPKGWDYRTVYHPLVRRHPVTGQKTLYAITGTSQGIQGMPQAEATALLNELGDHAFQDRFLARHTHREHDIVMWDNPTTMHSATPMPAATGPADTRLLRRISLRGMPPVFAESAARRTAATHS